MAVNVSEKKYINELWNTIKDKAADYSFYKVNQKGTGVLDPALIADYFLENYPSLVQARSNRPVYEVPHSMLMERLSRFLVSASREDYHVALKNKDGSYTIITKNGGRKKGLHSYTIPKPDKEADLMKHIALAAIRKDIEEISKERLKHKMNRPLYGALQTQSRHTETPKGSFERFFKSLIKEQGHDASPRETANYIFSTMAYSEKRKLNASLNSVGIKSNKDLESLLNKWKAEALKGIASPDRTRKRKVPIEMGR